MGRTRKGWTMVDLDRLKDVYKSQGQRQEDIANALGITLAAFNRKINGLRKFKVDEAATLVKILHLKPKETMEIFFGK